MKIKKILLCLLICIVFEIIFGFIDLCSVQEKKIARLTVEKDNLSKQLELISNPDTGVKYHGQLRVNGTNLIDKNGELFQLRGVSSHGLLWYPEYSNYGAINTIKKFGANVFRIAMYTEPSKGYVNSPEESFKLVGMAVENVLGADMYAIVDWHTLKDNNPNIYVDEAIDFFDKISSMYANNPAVIYEICNEPNGDTTWEDIIKYANKVIPIIRKNSPEAIIIVGTPKYCTNFTDVMNKPLEFDNVMYSFHYYTKLGKDNYISTLNEVSGKLPVIVSEWGISDNTDGIKLASGFIDYLTKNNISWINWSLSNKEESYSILKPNCSHYSNWTNECFTEIGKFVIDRLKLSNNTEY